MISEELFEKIIYLSKKGETLDKIMVRRLVKDIVSKTDFRTKRRLNHILFKKTSDFCARTNIILGNVCFNIKKCYKKIKRINCSTNLEKNLHFIAIILHEIEHLQESNKVRLNNIEGRLIQIADFQNNYYENGELNINTYYINPSEKLAYALSYLKLLNYLSQYPGFKENYKIEYDSIKNYYKNVLLLGYEKINKKRYNIPLIDFVINIKRISSLKEINFKLVKKGESKNIGKIDIEKRLMYGLPVSSYEIENFEKSKVLIKKV